MSQLINLFPLSVYKNLVGLDLNEREKLIDLILAIEKESLKNIDKGKNHSWLGDVNNNQNLQLNSEFNNLFDLLIINIKRYIELLNVDSNKFDIYIQRSWATISRGKEYIPQHKHHQSHLSFSYYLKKNKDDSAIIIHDTSKQNEFIPLLFNSISVEKKNFIKKRDTRNSPSVEITTEEDEIIIFPSKTLHSTQTGANNNERISISADIILLVKNSNGIEHLTPPFTDWKKF